ncbi:PREDICTED: cystatin-A-like [Poecilia mexicana]|uniref:cystatin-A-like n=1 Tax=Poecilia formosa TaxID=48698 RepID=UPI00044416FE|nr:PREDICTED: cystatin-A-like [Poecilia formosa]XP_014869567.1 PREDICTED: cystatin-A-like [Poecilia mexicana]
MSKEVTYGGWSETGPANEEVSALSKLMQKIAEANTNRKFNEFKAIEYRSQVVGGMKYLIKVQVRENDYVHLQVFQSPLQEGKIETKFEGVQDGHKRDDPLEPFKPF